MVKGGEGHRTPRDVVGGDAEPDGCTELGRLPVSHDGLFVGG
jgi:hypothetical protein